MLDETTACQSWRVFLKHSVDLIIIVVCIYTHKNWTHIHLSTTSANIVQFLSRVGVSTLTRDIDIAILSVRRSIRPSVCP